MGDLVNLRQARKRKAREADAARGAANRLAFGQPKAERERRRREAEREQRAHDQLRLEKE